MTIRVFYSWQSDTKDSRSVVQDALESAAASLGLEIDLATRDTPGAVDIHTTILEKIERCDVFVADVSIVNQLAEGRRCPNPNVMFELGYALREVGPKRIIQVVNTHWGEELPFDIRQGGYLAYCYKPDEPKPSVRRDLETKFKYELQMMQEHRLIPRHRAVGIRLERSQTYGASECHRYQLRVILTNHSDRIVGIGTRCPIRVQVKIPQYLLEPGVIHALRRPGADYFEQEINWIVHPGEESNVMPIDYHMTNDLFYKYRGEYPGEIEVNVWSIDERICRHTRLVRDPTDPTWLVNF